MPGGKGKTKNVVVQVAANPKPSKRHRKPAGGGKSKRQRAVAVARAIPPSITNGGYRMPFRTDSSSNSFEARISGMHNAIAPGGASSKLQSLLNAYQMSGPGAGRTATGIQGNSGNPYLDVMSDPSRGPMRIPDDYTKPTAIKQSVLFFTMNSGLAGGSTDKAGYFVCNPFIGDGTTVSYRNVTVSLGVGSGAGGYTTATYADPDRAALSGICNNIRPTSMCVFASYDGDTMTDGGLIAAALLPGNGLSTTLTSPTGQDLRLVSNLAIQPSAFSGRLSRGCYGIWAPEDPADTFFYTVSDAAAYKYPTLMVAYQSTQPATTVLRVLVIVNYEYTTSSTLVTTLPSPICPSMVTHAKAVLQNQPYFVANDDHVTWWTRVLNGARDLFSTIGTGMYDLFHPSVRMAGEIGNNQGLMSLASGYMGRAAPA